MIFRYWFHILLLISLSAIIGALIAEYVFNLQPCELCLKQRHPYYFFIMITILTLIILPLHKLLSSFLIQLCAIYGMFYSIWHVGVENGMIKGPSGCSTGLTISSNTTDLKEQILNKQVVSCDEVIWTLFGISAATINTLLLLFIFVINGLYLFKLWQKRKKVI